MAKIEQIVDIYTDGACRGNPGPGGWGAVINDGEQQQQLYGAVADTTNNRMELMAAIEALSSLKQSTKVNLTTDSQYLRQGITEWIIQWKRRAWRTAANKAVKNQDLWQRLDQQTHHHQISWHWVKGHAGHPGNEAADRLANQAIDELITGKQQ